ncbi:MAG: hypothetical protein EPO61_00690 [Nitrospirae bacterium]|nr:MAG: hypothetical protein EPO61_00690 [Nitrospirota bacterium]
MRRLLLLVACYAAVTGCTTVMGTNIAQDRLLPANAVVEKLGPVYGSASAGHWFWAVWADKTLYEEAKQDALRQKNGDVLLNAKITTSLTSYLSLYYRTEIAIMGTAAKLLTTSQ